MQGSPPQCAVEEVGQDLFEPAHEVLLHKRAAFTMRFAVHHGDIELCGAERIDAAYLHIVHGDLGVFRRLLRDIALKGNLHALARGYRRRGDRAEFKLHAVGDDRKHLDIIICAQILDHERFIAAREICAAARVKRESHGAVAVVGRGKLRIIGVGIDILDVIRQQQLRHERTGVFLIEILPVIVPLDKPCILRQISCRGVHLHGGRDVIVLGIIAGGARAGVAVGEALAERCGQRAAHAACGQHHVAVEVAAEGKLAARAADYRDLRAPRPALGKGFGELRHYFVVDYIGFCNKLFILNGVKVFIFEALICRLRAERPNAAPIADHIREL